MKSFVVLCMAAFAAVTMARPEEKYTTRYDNVDIQEILSNPRLLVPYIKCALDQGRCSPDGKELKSHIQEALENNCAKCSETQRKAVRTVIGHLINKEPSHWEDLTQKYDPNHKYSTKYEAELRTVKA